MWCRAGEEREVSVTDTKEKEILDTGLSLYHDSWAIVEGFHSRTALFENTGILKAIFCFSFYFWWISLDAKMKWSQEESWLHSICPMEFDLRIVGAGRGGILSVSGKKWIPWNYTALLILLQITTLAINYNVQQNMMDPANRHWFLDPVSPGCNLNMGFVIQYHHHHWKQRLKIRIDKIEITAGGRHQLRWSYNRQCT